MWQNLLDQLSGRIQLFTALKTLCIIECLFRIEVITSKKVYPANNLARRLRHARARYPAHISQIMVQVQGPDGSEFLLHFSARGLVNLSEQLNRQIWKLTAYQNFSFRLIGVTCRQLFLSIGLSLINKKSMMSKSLQGSRRFRVIFLSFKRS